MIAFMLPSASIVDCCSVARAFLHPCPIPCDRHRWAQVSEDTRATEALCRILCRFIRGEHGPPGGASFPFTSIQLNSRYASKRHVDANNAGHSMIIGLGDYEGGLLDVDGIGQLDVKRTWHM